MKKHLFLSFFFVVFYSFSQQMMYGPQRGQRGYIPPPRINASPYISAVDTYEELEKVLPKCVEMFSLDDFEREILKGMLVKKYDSYNKIVENTSYHTTNSSLMDRLEHNTQFGYLRMKYYP